MKKIAKRIIGALGTGALIAGIIIGANAHDKKEDGKVDKEVKTILVNSSWKYNGGEDDDPHDASLYVKIEDTNPSCPGIAETVCRLNAPADPSNPSRPDMSASVTTSGGTFTVAQRITSALTSPIQTNETVDGLRAF